MVSVPSDDLTDEEADVLRMRLLQYPDVDESNVDREVAVYALRKEAKAELLRRDFGNALAEASLDRQGWPRPPGWHSVFFYPGSNRPRNGYLFWLAASIAAAAFILS